MDFTVKIYKKMLFYFIQKGYDLISYGEYLKKIPKLKEQDKILILRHDVDRNPYNSLIIAKIQNYYGIKGTYYFRAVPQCWNEEVVSEIVSHGHEIGYHYEDLNFAAEQPKFEVFRDKPRESEEFERILVGIAIESFNSNLDKMRKIASVNTICMHGSPLSAWDSRLLWKYYDYHKFGIESEPYFDTNFENVFYLTDTGRRWDGQSVNVRDKAIFSGINMNFNSTFKKPNLNIVDSIYIDPYQRWVIKPVDGSLMNMTKRSYELQKKHKFHSSIDIINGLLSENLPTKIMMTLHPQRWTDNILPWLKEFAFQNIKNVAKYYIVNYRN